MTFRKGRPKREDFVLKQLVQQAEYAEEKRRRGISRDIGTKTVEVRLKASHRNGRRRALQQGSGNRGGEMCESIRRQKGIREDSGGSWKESITIHLKGPEKTAVCKCTCRQKK